MQKVLVVYGTRPEAIKMAPLIEELGRSAHCTPVVAVTGQHRAMLDQVNKLFGIRPDHDLNVLTERQRLEDITCRVLDGVSHVIMAEGPDAVLVQGDTTTCFAAALAAFYRKVPVVHLEAGLQDRRSLQSVSGGGEPPPDDAVGRSASRAHRYFKGQFAARRGSRTRHRRHRQYGHRRTFPDCIPRHSDRQSRPQVDRRKAERPDHRAQARILGRADGADRVCSRPPCTVVPG